MIDAGSGVHIALILFTIAFVLAFIRLLRGPSLPDRVVALDLMVVIGIGFIAAYAIETEKSVFVDVATVVALIGFLATVAFAYHVRRGSG
jgi:multicomponent Na+:H+ antiporter subunit F